MVNAGHQLVKKSPDAPVAVRADSFVVETDVHFPTDINLLWDALRKLIEIMADLCADFDVPGWRQSAYQLRQVKKLYRQVQRTSTRRPRTPPARCETGGDAPSHRDYLTYAEHLLVRVRERRFVLESGRSRAVAGADRPVFG